MFRLAYCDYIIDCIKVLLQSVSDRRPEHLVESVGGVEWDLHPVEGYMLSTRKALTVWDSNGKAYVVSVEEAPALDREVCTQSLEEVST